MKSHSYRGALWTLSGVTLVHVCAVLAAYQFSVSGQDILELRPPVLVAKLVAESRPKVAATPAPSAVPEPKSEPRSAPKPEVKPQPRPVAKLESKPETKPEPELASKPNETEVAAPALLQKLPESLPYAQPDTAILIPPRVEAHGRGNVPPAYPVLSKRLKEEGEVLLQIRILRDGSVSDIRIQRSSGYARLDAAALAAVKHWRYQPASVNGQAIEYDYVQPIEFKLH